MRRAPIRLAAPFAAVVALAALALTSAIALAGDAAATAPPAAKADVAPAAVPAPAPPAPAAEPDKSPDHIKVQHILIGFTGSVPGKNVTRTQEAARALAAQVFARAKKGEDFDALVKEFTDDRAPGFYTMSNTKVPAIPPEYARETMVKSFGDVSFSLKVGEIGMAEYDHANSRFGWHIIKRIE